MTVKGGIYKCSVCGNVVEVLTLGGGELVCCGKPMILQEANTQDASKEKHVPVVEKSANQIKVKVGSIPHPMEEKHFIQWIAIKTANNVCRKELKPGAAPEAVFQVNPAEVLEVLEYCNLHGLWKTVL
jgi:superoxide reductase